MPDAKSTTSKRPTTKLKTTEIEVHSSVEAKPGQKVNTFLQFAFQMDSIVLNLFERENVGLASFGIHFLSLKGHKLADESLSASIVLLDIQLDDIRPDREKYITRFAILLYVNYGHVLMIYLFICRFMKRKTGDDEPAITGGNDPNESYNDKTKSMVDIVVRIKDDDTFGMNIDSFKVHGIDNNNKCD